MLNFIKRTLVSGLLILVPLVLLYLAVREVFELMVGFATPIADLFPKGTFDHVRETEIIAVLLILGTAFAFGLIARIKGSSAVGGFIESNSLNKLPIYRMIKSLVGAFLNMEGEASFKPAFVETALGELEPCYVIEDLGHPRVVVLIPTAPAAFAGFVKLVPRESVKFLPVTLDEFSLSLTHLGIGMSALLPRDLNDDGK